MADFINDFSHWDDDGIEDPAPLYSGGLKTCRYCGTEGLHWEKWLVGWRLADKDNIIHRCHYKETTP